MRCKYALEYAEPYIVKTELTKNRTHQTYRWKQLAMSNDLEELKKYLSKYRRIIDWNTLEVIIQHPVQH